MGHYASEMNAPVRHDPETLIKRRESARESAAYRWELYQRYEEEGVWIRESETLTCPQCFCRVPALLRVDHEGIHS